jgi:hypothetical protein
LDLFVHSPCGSSLKAYGTGALKGEDGKRVLVLAVALVLGWAVALVLVLAVALVLGVVLVLGWAVPNGKRRTKIALNFTAQSLAV